jgi:hypothetical protein
MVARIAIVAGALILIGMVWVLVPPFPRADTLLSKSLPELREQLGAPEASGEAALASSFLAKSVVWTKRRGLADWTVRADWLRGDATGHPSTVSRCLRLRWLPEAVSVFLLLPCDTAMEARVGVARVGI